MPEGPVGSNRLTSWQEIAAFFDVSVRTAQNWEKDLDLPVHRLDRKRGPVFAYPSELEEWLQGNANRSQGIPETETRDREPPPKPATGRVKPKTSRLLLAFAALGVLLVLFLSAWTLMKADRSPAAATIEPSRLKVMDKNGKVLWRSGELFAEHAAGSRPDGRKRIDDYVLIEDIDDDGLAEVFFSDFASRPEGRQGKIHAFTFEGKPLWSRPLALGREIEWNGRFFTLDYFCQRPMQVFEAQGEAHLLILINHTKWFPSAALVVRARDGEVESEYWHPGRIVLALPSEIGAAGEKAFIFAGVNNAGPGAGNAFVSKVKIRDLFAARFNPSDPFGFANSVASDYLLLENSDVAKSGGTRNAPSRLTMVGSTLCLHLIPGGYFANITPDLSSVKFEVSDELAKVHRQLEVSGNLDHPFSTTEITSLKVLHFQGRHPNANSDELRLSLGERGW